MIMEVFSGLSSVIFNIYNLLSVVGGLILGICLGALPGVGSTMGVALLIPFTFYLTPGQSILLLTAVYSGAVFGGSISAILLKIPGSYEAIATSFDGYPLAQQGKAGKALGMAILSSAIGGIIGAVALYLLAPQLAKFALAFGPPEYFALAIMGLSVLTSVINKSFLKGLISAGIGLFLATIGIDKITGTLRFTFGSTYLLMGLSLLPVIIGMFALSQVFEEVKRGEGEKVVDLKTVSAKLPSLKEVFSLRKTIVKSSILGTIIGILPGVGATVASIVSYSEAVRSSNNPEKFGTGALEGIAAPESANNAACGGAMIPLLALGIPGSAVTAVMVGAFMIHGLRPGPLLFVEQRPLVYMIFAGFLLTNVLMITGGLYGAKLFARVLEVPYKYLGPFVVVLCTIGSFAINNNLTDVWVMLLFAFFAYLLNKQGFPFAPMLLGLILGSLAETSFRRGILTTGGSFLEMISRPITAILLLVSLLFLFYPLIREFKKRKKSVKEVSRKINI